MSELKVVPAKPTEEMMIAASQVGYPLTYQNVLRIWGAMLNAAPVEFVCKGSMALGTGCGKCSRCKEEIGPSETEMLDWLIESNLVMDKYANGDRVLFNWWKEDTVPETRAKTARETIKIAMKLEQEK